MICELVCHPFITFTMNEESTEDTQRVLLLKRGCDFMMRGLVRKLWRETRLDNAVSRYCTYVCKTRLQRGKIQARPAGRELKTVANLFPEYDTSASCHAASLHCNPHSKIRTPHGTRRRALYSVVPGIASQTVDCLGMEPATEQSC
jgi:hypothetical protein